MQLKIKYTSNSQIIARGEAECNFHCYEYNYSLIALKIANTNYATRELHMHKNTFIAFQQYKIL